MDAFELGKKGDPSSVSFHANATDYISTLRASHAQPKRKWLMMQMTETHPERRLVRSVFRGEWGEGDVRLTPERPGRMSVRRYLMMMGTHRYVLSPRGNGAARPSHHHLPTTPSRVSHPYLTAAGPCIAVTLP